MTMGASSTPKNRGSESTLGLRQGTRSGLEMMLTDAVVEDGGVSRFFKPRAAGRTIAGLAVIRVVPRVMRVLSGRSSRGSLLGARSSRRPRAIAASATARGATTGCCAGRCRAT